MDVSLFDFDLPSDLIAQTPAVNRDAARLLTIGATLADRAIVELPDLLRPGDLLIVNDTRVLPVRFEGHRAASGERPALVFAATLVEPSGTDHWWALCRPAKRLRAGDPVRLGQTLLARVAGKDDEGRVLLAFELEGQALLAGIKAEGAMPLPPYIHRPAGATAADRLRYQTVFAARDGAVAAPTAALHFTEALLARLAAAGIERASLTLHVGMGTFQPVKAEDTAGHIMHEEWYELPAATVAAIERTRAQGGRVVAVGTTVLRTLESALDDQGRIVARSGRTGIFITPGWQFRTADLLLTNFHLPRSTLFMLVSAFGGMDRLKAAYAHAIKERYRFFSYGDACLIERAEASLPG
ncbi:S-adenosylmethionine:tRNA ribosyltransferase-isomerase [Arboricoccus pini]|uniref:S-adenosylmethionine:tRNA ribosyltransferase-isomerase n=1 Tax=Arboricoccus pini TaxID=1963835 RepID=A0A212R694_9PROT|nr:tRNA preQ1(34) S-adenosylmethionine ribosyltransferase-isomerase QueA [Arboricoccus pini]SNB67675.1 S-adenosylmethionine:tRNA ribosyltransferase-isomerase [Arboricoccus pini]